MNQGDGSPSALKAPNATSSFRPKAHQFIARGLQAVDVCGIRQETNTSGSLRARPWLTPGVIGVAAVVVAKQCSPGRTPGPSPPAGRRWPGIFRERTPSMTDAGHMGLYRS